MLNKNDISESERLSLEKLSNDIFWFKRVHVAENLNCPIYLLEKLSRDTNSDVRKAVVLNPSCSDLILDNIISVETKYSVIFHTVFHKNCSFNTLKKIHQKYEKLRDIIKFHSNWKLQDFE